MKAKLNTARASAPASVGNVGVGFDVLGLAFDAARDTVSVTVEAQRGVRLGQVSGLGDNLPAETDRNCALAAAAAVLDAAKAWLLRIEAGEGIKLHLGTWHAGPLFDADSASFFNLELSDTNQNDHETLKLNRSIAVELN